jgi:hypothetical protein
VTCELIGLTLLLGAIVAALWGKYWRPAAQRTCVRCGYSLIGIPTRRCPECGLQHTLADRGRPRREHREWFSVAVILALIGALALLVHQFGDVFLDACFQ